MKKRILSLLLALVLVIGMLPTVAFAAEGTETASTDGPTTTYWESDTISWSFDGDTGTLTISGSGAMPDGSITRADDDSIVGLLEAPWNVYCKQIVSVSVAEDITTIGARAFKSCANLKNVVLPESIMSIGADAFNGCSGMEYLYVGSNVAVVETIWLTTLKDVYYNESNENWDVIKGSFPSTARFHSVAAATDIDGHYSSKITSEATCESVGETVYSCDCGYNFTETIPTIDHDYGTDGVCSCGKAKPLAEGTCGVNEALRWDISQDGVLTISGSGAMDNNDRELWYNNYRNVITGIVVESGVTSIGASAFVECRNVESVSISDTVTSIGSGAFSHCYFDAITIPASVTSIGSRAFTFNRLSTFNVAEDNTAFKVESGALFSQDGTTLISYPGRATATEYTIPEGVTTVYEGAFWGCKYLQKLTLSSTMTVPQTSALGTGFGYLWNLTEYDVVDGNTAFKDENGILLSTDGSTLVSYPNGRKNFVLPDGITVIGSFSIACDETINTIFIPDTITTLQYGAFSDCHNLKTLVIGENVATMANRSFAACSALDSVYFKGAAPTSFDADAFKFCDGEIVFYYETEHKDSWTTSTAYDAEAQTWNGYPLREVYKIGTTRIGGIDCAYTIGADGVQVFLAQNGEEVAQGSVSIDLNDLGSTSVTVQTDKANVTFDAAALTKIKGGQATQIDLSYEEIKSPASSGSLNDLQKEAAADAEKVIVLELEDGSAQKVEFGNAEHTNDGSATVTVPYTQKDSDKTPVVYYVDEDGNKTALESTYDTQTGTITFVTSHFSVFAVVETSESGTEDGETEETPSVDYSGQVASDVKLALDEETGLPVLTWNNPAGYGEYSLNYRVLASTDGTTWTSLIKTNIIPCPLYEYLPANTSPYTHFKVVTLDSNLADVTGTDSNIATGSITVAETASSNTAVSVALSGTTSAATVEISGLFAETALVMFQAENFDEDGNRTAECRMASVSDCTATFNEWDLSAYTSYTITEVSASYDDTPSVCTVVRNTSVTSATLDKSGLSDDTTDYSTLIATGVAITSDSSTGLPVLTWNNPAGCEEYSLDYRVLASTDGTTWNDNIVDTNTIPAELYRHLPASDTPYTYFKVITLDSNRNPVTGTDSNIATGSITITESSVSSDTVNVALSGTTSAATVEISGLADDTSVVIFTARNAETKKGTSKVLTVSGGSASYTHRTLDLSAYTTYTVTEIAGKCDTATSSYTVTRNTSASGNLSDLWDNGTGEDSETGSTTVGQNDFGLTLTVEDYLLYYQLTLPDSELDDTGVGAEAYYVRIYDSNTKAMYSCSVWSDEDYKDHMWALAEAGTYDTVEVRSYTDEETMLAQWTLTTPITVTTGKTTLPTALALKALDEEAYCLTGADDDLAYSIYYDNGVYTMEYDNKLAARVFWIDAVGESVDLYSLCADQTTTGFTLDISAPMSLSVPAYEGEETESDLTRAGICVEIVEAMGWTYSEDMAVTFNDVDSTHDAYTAIAIMVSKGHIKGYATGEFDPDGDLTRAEVAKILCSVLKKDGEVDTDVLPGDIPADNWAAGYICTALNEGLMWTFEDDCFRPYDPAVGSDVDFDKLAFYAGNAWTLTFDFNTDDSELWVGTNKTYVRKGDAAKLLVRGEDFERPYYVFQGWFTEDGTLVTDETVINGDMTLYAHWEKRTTFALILYVSEILGYDENGDPYGDYVKPGTYTVAMTGPNGTTITAKEGTGEGDAPLIYSGLVAAEAENYTLTIERDGYKNYTITMAGDPYGQGSSLADMGLYMGSVIFSTAGVWQPLSGSCGDNVNWTLTDTSENQDGSAYTLTVFKVDTTLADGWMYHMDSAKEQPWAWARQEITKIVVKDGVQNVGSYAFAMCRNVTEVVLPDSVTEIAERSFVNCSGLTSLALPYVVVQIDSTAFYNCTGLTAFKMGAAPEPETGETPVCWYTVKDGVLFRLVWTTSEDGTETSSPDELVCYPAVKTLTDENGDAVTVYSIPEGTRIIGESAFRSCNLTEIVIPASVSNVMPYAFDRCFDLTAITVAKDNEQYTTNDDGVLYYVVDAETANWTLVCYPAAKAGAYELPAAVTNIQDGAFGRCFNLTAITVAEGNTKYIAEDGVLFTACEQLADPENSNSEMVTVPDTLICYPVGKEGTSYTAPESMSMIGEGAFAYANVSEIILSGWVHVGDYAFEKCNGGSIAITFDEEGAGFGPEAFAGTSNVICYYPAGSMVWENMMNDGNDHCYGGDNVTWKAIYDDSKAVTDLKIVKNEYNDEYYLSWTELEGEHEYRIFLRVTNEDGEQEWREFGRTNRNRWDMNDLPEDEFSAIKVETLNEYDYAVAQTILDASITVEVLEKGGTEPESVTFIRMEEDSAEFLFAASGLKESTPYRVIFTKINENDEPDEWGVTWNTDKNGAIKVEINPNCDSDLTEWFYFAIEEEIAVTYQIYEVTFAMDEDTGALTVTRSACGDAAKVVWYLDGSDELMDDAYAVTGLQFEKGNTANYTENGTEKESALHNLSWKAPAGDEDTVIDADELEYVVYFGIAAKGEAVEGESAEGESAEGEAVEGEATESEATEGEVTEGEVTESEATEGEVTEGEVTEGEVTEGEATEGDSTEEEAVEIDWVACCEVGSDTWLNLFELAEKSYEYIAVKVVTRQNGITRAEVVSDLHTLTVVRNEVEDTETTPDVVVYRKDAEGHDYTVKITDLEKNTWYHFQLRANNEEGWNVQAGDTWFSGDDTEHTFETCGDWITEAFADANDDFHIHYSLKQLSSALTENEDEDTQHVGLTYVEVVYKYNPTYEEMPAYDDDQVKVTDVHFEIADGTPYLCWDAPVSALDGLTYHVYFEYDEQGSGWPVGEETRADLDNLSAESYHTIRIHSKLNGITVGEVKIDLTAADGMSLIVKETEDSKAKLMIDDSADDAQRFLFSGLALNGAFRFEAYTEAGGPDGPSDRCDWTADAKGMCEEHRGNWLDVDREFIGEDGNSVTVTMRKGGVYRIVEKSAALDETTGSLTITYSTTGWKKVADVIAVSTAPKTGDVTVKEDLELTEDQETEVTEAASGVTVDLVEESVEVKHEELKDEKGNAFEIPEENDETTVEEGITLEIEVQKYEVPVKDEETGDTDSDTTKLVLDITPVYTVTVTTKSETEGEKDTVQTAKAPVDTTGTPVVVTIPLPKSFVEAAGWNLYVIHTKDGKTEYTHQVNVQCTYDEETGEVTGYYVSFVNTEGFSKFAVTGDAVGLTYTDSEGNEQSDTYSDLQSALNDARNQVRNDCTDVTVKLLVDDLEEGTLMISAGVTLDLNGMYVKAANVLSFGSVIDTADEAGGIVISNDRGEAFVQLQPGNEYLPIYDTTYSDEIGCYRFYKYEVVNLGGIKYGTNAVMFGIRIVFEKTKAYEVLGNTTDSDVELSTVLNWGKDLAYTFNADTVKKFGTLAYGDLIADSSKTTTSKAIFLTVSGLSALGEGGTISSQPTVESVTGTVGSGELMQYPNAVAE